jgi:prepilin peptidase CpaA
MTQELKGLLVLIVLALLLLFAACEDIRSRRIPNKLVLIGILSGFGFNGLLISGLGWLAAAQGFALGMAILLPMYLLGAMGAGDVKLMGMVGAFLGPADLTAAVIATFIAGGLMALAVALWSKQLMSMLRNIKLMLFSSLLRMNAGQLPVMNDLPVSVAKLPYAVAIMVGTLSYLGWQHM